jgi:hypothetical protein
MDANADALRDIHDQLQGCARTVEALETLLLELIGKAGAQGDPSVIERAQAVDALSQQLQRLAKSVGELARSCPTGEPLKETLAMLAKRPGAEAKSGEVDLF